MKDNNNNNIKTMLVVMALGGLAWPAAAVRAQDSSAVNTTQPAVVNTLAPQLAYRVPQILQLAQAKVGDNTIIAYIKNSGNSYGLNADQIIYLRQQGVSDAIITAMLSQPKLGVATATPTPAASQPMDSTAGGQSSTATVAPTVTYVQTVPATTGYYYQPYYYPAYAWYPPVAFSFGWGGGWHGGGWRGGWHR